MKRSSRLITTLLSSAFRRSPFAFLLLPASTERKPIDSHFFSQITRETKMKYCDFVFFFGDIAIRRTKFTFLNRKKKTRIIPTFVTFIALLFSNSIKSEMDDAVRPVALYMKKKDSSFSRCFLVSKRNNFAERRREYKRDARELISKKNTYYLGICIQTHVDTTEYTIAYRG